MLSYHRKKLMDGGQETSPPAKQRNTFSGIRTNGNSSKSSVSISLGNWRKFSQWIVFGLISSVAIAGCQTSTNTTNPSTNQLKVVATSTIIADLTERVGGDEIALTSMLKPGDDPHVYEPTPQDSRTLEEAQLVFYNGYNLEPGIIKMMESTSRNARRVAVGEVAKPLTLEKEGQTVPDPHVWGDVKNVILMVNKIRDELASLSPADKAEFTENAVKLTQELEQLDQAIAQQIQTIPPNRRKLVTTHDAFQYYGKAYGLEILGTLIGISTEEKPSAQTVKNLVTNIQKNQVPAIFAETTLNDDLIKTVAEEAKVKLSPTKLYSDSIDVKGSRGDSYIKMMQANTTAIVEALR